jgi:hypothetical protein
MKIIGCIKGDGICLCAYCSLWIYGCEEEHGVFVKEVE